MIVNGHREQREAPENAESLSCISFPLHPWPKERRASTEGRRGHGMSWERTERKAKVFTPHRPEDHELQRQALEERMRHCLGMLTAGTFILEGCRSITEI